MSNLHNFGNEFNPEQWTGFRVSQYQKAEDMFQQLVGDALKSQFFDHAFVAPTLGRDGSIDAWVDDNAEAIGQFADVNFPLIVECKHHDATSQNLRQNITQGWTKVRNKLEEQAEAGWQGAYQPWKNAQGYIYCISARFSSANEREELQEKIRRFFSKLPEGQRPRFRHEQIRVWDWNDLTHWFRTQGRLTDDWLGIGFNDLEDHGTYLERLIQSGTSFHAYLLNEKLPFIEPESQELFHPDKVLKRLSDGENLVVVGDGGVGKTRLVFEIAEQAHQNGYRVLHLRPTEEVVNLRALTEELLRYSGNTLVTADYIDQFRDFDARYWTHTLLPEAKRRGLRLTLIANARPLAASQILSQLVEQKLFSIVEMKPSAEQRQRINRQIEAVICPRAIQVLGETKVRTLCGPRPIIAMLIARELEHQVIEGHLGHDDLPRPGDLCGWISKRLHEDKLLPNAPVSPWELPSLSPALCATTAALIACPISRDELIAVVATTLNSLTSSSQISPTQIINTLQRGGWLEEEAHDLRTPHDAVTDEILQSTLTQYPDTLPTLFASASHGRPLGRYATCLSRLAGLGEGASQPILARASQWLTQEARSLSKNLIAADPDVSAYALGAVFNCPPLSNTALEVWPQLITPWLTKYADHPAARHLLFQGLKQLPEQEAYRLRDASFGWLNKNLVTLDAGFVLGPLLGWSQAELGDRENELRKLAMEWLQKHPLEEETQFVLYPLLGWSQGRLDSDEAELRKLAMAWSQKYPLKEETRFVLYPLLGWSQDRLDGDEAELRKLAMDWLQDYPLEEETGFVLAPLLGWSQGRLDSDEAELRKLSMAWLQKYPLEEETGFVLAPLLGWSQNRVDSDEAELRKLSMAWLQKYPLEEVIQFVLAPSLAGHRVD
ncbi:MAG: hypothetical protein GKR96_06225 [Gammaproteobacteria bacterium]|nr:hypothetical protein [Gammaproteobacteria bacterium]